MINDEFLLKIEAIIEYLEENGGYSYKLYNHTCKEFNNEPDSNIVEYAKDIKDFWETLKYNDDLESYIKMEICKIIMDNLNLFALDDSKLIHLKQYCKSKMDAPSIPTPNDILIDFVYEALLDLQLANFLYDFRKTE